MRHRTNRYSSLIVLLGLSLQVIATAQQPTLIVIYTRSGLIAAIPGQTLRVTLSDLSAANTREPVLEPLGVLVELRGAGGELIAQTQSALVQPDRFQSFDFNRDLIELPGESGTGRLQVLVKVSIRFLVANELQGTPNEKRLEDFPVSLEVIDNSTGRTRVMWTKLSLKREFPGDP